MRDRGWDALDVILVSGDAYVDHPSYGTAVIGRVLEAAGLRVGVIAQPDWRGTGDFMRLGSPRLFFGITAGNLDSMVSNYTSHKKARLRDAYSPGGRPGLRPDRATIVYSNRVREAFGHIPIILGGIEASLRRLAHYDWWDNRVRRSLLLDAKADVLVYGMGETQVLEIARRLDRRDRPGGHTGHRHRARGLPVSGGIRRDSLLRRGQRMTRMPSIGLSCSSHKTRILSREKPCCNGTMTASWCSFPLPGLSLKMS